MTRNELGRAKPTDITRRNRSQADDTAPVLRIIADDLVGANPVDIAPDSILAQLAFPRRGGASHVVLPRAGLTPEWIGLA